MQRLRGVGPPTMRCVCASQSGFLTPACCLQSRAIAHTTRTTLRHAAQWHHCLRLPPRCPYAYLKTGAARWPAGPPIAYHEECESECACRRACNLYLVGAPGPPPPSFCSRPQVTATAGPRVGPRVHRLPPAARRLLAHWSWRLLVLPTVCGTCTFDLKVMAAVTAQTVPQRCHFWRRLRRCCSRARNSDLQGLSTLLTCA